MVTSESLYHTDLKGGELKKVLEDHGDGKKVEAILGKQMFIAAVFVLGRHPFIQTRRGQMCFEL